MAFKHTFTYYYGEKEIEETKTISASKAIRYKCLDCSGGSVAEVKGCGIPKCPLWPFRFGKSRPFDEKASKRALGRVPGFKKKSVSVELQPHSGDEN